MRGAWPRTRRRACWTASSPCWTRRCWRRSSAMPGPSTITTSQRSSGKQTIRDKQEKYSLYCIVLILGVLVTGIYQYHRLKMELDLHSLFGLLCTNVLICWDPQPPPPTPRIWAHIRGRCWSAKIDISFNLPDQYTEYIEERPPPPFSCEHKAKKSKVFLTGNQVISVMLCVWASADGSWRGSGKDAWVGCRAAHVWEWS